MLRNRAEASSPQPSQLARIQLQSLVLFKFDVARNDCFARQHAHQRIDQRRLSAAGLAQNSYHFPWAEFEVEAPQSMNWQAVVARVVDKNAGNSQQGHVVAHSL